MSKKKYKVSKNKHPILFLVIIAILLAYAGWKVYAQDAIQSMQTPKLDGSVEYSIRKPDSPRVSPTPDKRNMTPINLGNNVLGIPELGIKIKVPDGLIDLVYYKQAEDSVLFSTARLTNLAENCMASLGPVRGLKKTLKAGLSAEDELDLKKRTTVHYSDLAGSNTPANVKEFTDFYISLLSGVHIPCGYKDNNETDNDINDEQDRLSRNILAQIEQLE